MILYRESIQSIVVVVSVRETREIPFSGEIEDLFFGRSGGGGCSEGNSPDEPSRWEEKRREDRIGEREEKRERKKKMREKKGETEEDAEREREREGVLRVGVREKKKK